MAAPFLPPMQTVDLANGCSFQEQQARRGVSQVVFFFADSGITIFNFPYVILTVDAIRRTNRRRSADFPSFQGLSSRSTQPSATRTWELSSPNSSPWLASIVCIGGQEALGIAGSSNETNHESSSGSRLEKIPVGS